jgi:hypothetical protein
VYAIGIRVYPQSLTVIEAHEGPTSESDSVGNAVDVVDSGIDDDVDGEYAVERSDTVDEVLL